MKGIVRERGVSVKILLKILTAIFSLILIVCIYGLFFESDSYDKSRDLVRENSALKQEIAELKKTNEELAEDNEDLEAENSTLSEKVSEYEEKEKNNNGWWFW